MTSEFIAVDVQDIRTMRFWFKGLHSKQNIQNYHNITNLLKRIKHQAAPSTAEFLLVPVADLEYLSQAINVELFSNFEISNEQFSTVLNIFTRILAPLAEMD